LLCYKHIRLHYSLLVCICSCSKLACCANICRSTRFGPCNSRLLRSSQVQWEHYSASTSILYFYRDQSRGLFSSSLCKLHTCQRLSPVMWRSEATQVHSAAHMCSSAFHLLFRVNYLLATFFQPTALLPLTIVVYACALGIGWLNVQCVIASSLTLLSEHTAIRLQSFISAVALH
jgi:hypothetical protein